ncbi:MAG: HAD family phosphatase [Spirochaetales bacterium]|nr:HAD family phosphatase [Candidatus Physcosoma equi]
MILASDIDGTFYFSSRSIPYNQGDLDAIRRWQEKGHLFGVCTGRSEDSAYRVLEGFVKPDFFIFTNGSLIKDGNGRELFSASIDKILVERLLSLKGPVAPTFTERQRGGKQSRHHGFEEYQGGLIESASFLMPSEKDAEVHYKKVVEAVGEDLNIFLNTIHVDVSPKGVTKGTAVECIQSHYGDEVYGIGDTWCDLPLLQASRTSFTFQSSPEDVKKAATHVVATLEEAISLLLQKEI